MSVESDCECERDRKQREEDRGGEMERGNKEEMKEDAKRYTVCICVNFHVCLQNDGNNSTSVTVRVNGRVQMLCSTSPDTISISFRVSIID